MSAIVSTTGLRVFVTGASSGIGEALARELHRRMPGVRLGLVARRADRLASVAASMPGVSAECYPVDVTDRAALAAAAREFVERHGVPDVVIANAGISAGTITGAGGDAEVFERIMRVNVVAMYDTFAPFVPGMRRERRGTLVGIASVAGIRGLPGSGGYSASKAASIAYLESLRVELARDGVAVVTIAPGFIRTPMTEGNRYRMPFLMDVDAFARDAVDAIVARRSFVVIPWPMRWVALAMRALPNPLYDACFARMPRKARIDEASGAAASHAGEANAAASHADDAIRPAGSRAGEANDGRRDGEAANDGR